MRADLFVCVDEQEVWVIVTVLLDQALDMISVVFLIVFFVKLSFTNHWRPEATTVFTKETKMRKAIIDGKRSKR